MPNNKNAVVIRDTDKPFEPSTGSLPESDRYVWSNKRARVVSASIVKTPATRVGQRQSGVSRGQRE